MKFFISCMACLLLVSCQVKEQENQANKAYFDLEGYFKAEALRLKQENPAVNKMVSINGKVEQKNLKISNWDKELAAFSAADINKTSWRGAFERKETITSSKSIGNIYFESPTTTDTTTIYQSYSNTIPVKSLNITKQAGKISAITIIIENTNDLYHSNDTLTYLPNRLYHIKKVQKIKLLEEKRYEIKGEFKR